MAWTQTATETPVRVAPLDGGAGGAAAEEAASWWSWLESPGVLEALVASVVIGLLAAWAWRLWAHAHHASRRRAAAERTKGLQLLRADDPDRALKHLEKSVQKDPDDPVARWALGQALLQLGQAASAHKHLLVLRRAYRVLGPDAEAAWLEAMVATGQAEAALREAPRRPSEAVHQAWHRAARAAGRWTEAAATARRLGALADAADAEWRSAQVALADGEVEAASAAAFRAESDGLDASRVARLRLQLAAARGATPEALLTELAKSAPVVHPLVGAGPAASGDARCRALAALAPLDDRRLGLPLDHADAVLDALEQNRAWIGRLVRAARSGDSEAAQDLVGLGPRAVPALVEAAVAHDDEDEPTIDILRRMGPGILDTLFGFHRRELGRPGVERDRLTARVGAVLRAMDRAALPVLGELLGEADRDLRPLVLDFHLGLGDPGVVVDLLERCSAVEIIQRLDRAPDPVLRQLLERGTPTGVLTDLFGDPAFSREDVLVDFVHYPVAAATLLRRGWSPRMGGRLLDATADPARQSPALELLRKFGSEAAPQLASAWADPARPEAQRAVLEPLLVSLGEAAVAPLLRLIGPESAPGDEAVARVLLALGDDAIPALAAGVADPSAGRPHRTEWILRLLHRAGAAGHAALERLADSDLAGEHRLLVARLLHARRDANHDGGDHGQVG